jgi:hypothetical protein
MFLTLRRLVCAATIVATITLAAPGVAQECSTDNDCNDTCAGPPCVNGTCNGGGVCVELQCDTPSLTCPASFTTAASPGASSGVVTFPDPTGSPTPPDLCFQSLACVPASGSAFPLGDTTVTCTLVTLTGGQATCSFVATLSTTPIPMLSGASLAALASLLALAGAGVLMRGRT